MSVCHLAPPPAVFSVCGGEGTVQQGLPHTSRPGLPSAGSQLLPCVACSRILGVVCGGPPHVGGGLGPMDVPALVSAGKTVLSDFKIPTSEETYFTYHPAQVTSVLLWQ